MVDFARVQKELQECSRDIERSGIKVIPKCDGNLAHLVGTIPGPISSPYEGGTFQIDISLPVINAPLIPSSKLKMRQGRGSIKAFLIAVGKIVPNGSIPVLCSQHTAEDMAMLAYNRALKLSSPGCPVLGVGFTGSLATSRPKLGDHRFYLSTRTSDRLSVSRVTLSKGLRIREEEVMVASHLVLKFGIKIVHLFIWCLYVAFFCFS